MRFYVDLPSFLDAIRNPTGVGLITFSPNDLLGDDDLALLAEALKTATQPIKLNLSNNCIDYKGAKYFADALKVVTQPVLLNLGANNIGDEGAKCFADALQTAKQPVTLSLLWNLIGDKGAKCFADALKIATQPVALDLLWNNIGACGAALFLAVIKSGNCPFGTRITGLGEDIEEACLENDAVIARKTSEYEKPICALLHLHNVDENKEDCANYMQGLIAALAFGPKNAYRMFTPSAADSVAANPACSVTQRLLR